MVLDGPAVRSLCTCGPSVVLELAHDALCTCVHPLRVQVFEISFVAPHVSQAIPVLDYLDLERPKVIPKKMASASVMLCAEF